LESGGVLLSFVAADAIDPLHGTPKQDHVRRANFQGCEEIGRSIEEAGEMGHCRRRASSTAAAVWPESGVIMMMRRSIRRLARFAASVPARSMGRCSP
jgi:hypothetical protein